MLTACSGSEVSAENISLPQEDDSMSTIDRYLQISPESDHIIGYPAIGIKLGVVNKTPGIKYRTSNVRYECSKDTVELELDTDRGVEYNGTTIMATEFTSFDNNLQRDTQNGIELTFDGNTDKFSEKTLSLIVRTDSTSRKDLSTFQDDYVVNVNPKPTNLRAISLDTRSFDYADRIIGVSICMMR